MDAWPRFWDWNKPLFEQHIAAGFQFIQKNKTAHFVDADGKYVAFPIGYITSQYDKHDINPHCASVQLGDGWAQYKGKSISEVERKARKRASEAVDEWLQNLINS